LTVTHPEIKRFFMMTREAVALVLQGFAIGKHWRHSRFGYGRAVKDSGLGSHPHPPFWEIRARCGDPVHGITRGEKLSEEFSTTRKVISIRVKKSKRTNGTLKGTWPRLCRNWMGFVFNEHRWRGTLRTRLGNVPEYSYLENHQSPDISKEPV